MGHGAPAAPQPRALKCSRGVRRIRVGSTMVPVPKALSQFFHTGAKARLRLRRQSPIDSSVLSQLRAKYEARKPQFTPQTGAKKDLVGLLIRRNGMLRDDACAENYRFVAALELCARALPDMALVLWQTPNRADQRSSFADRYPIIGTGFLFQLKSGRTSAPQNDNGLRQGSYRRPRRTSPLAPRFAR